MKFALEMQDLHCRYPDGTEALQGFSASIGAGECVGLVGPNGAGKTTLLLTLAGFLLPDPGEIRLFGEKAAVDRADLLRSAIGFTFHNPDDQLFMPTVIEDICFGLLRQGVEGELAAERAKAMMDQMGILDLQHSFPGHLSAGQKHLAALAGILVMEPKIIALDEPTAFLDPYSRRQVIEITRRTAQTKLLVTHDLELVLELCSRVIIIFAGKNVSEGDPRVVLADREQMALYHLEVPCSLR